MKTFWGAVVAVVVAVLLTGCGEAAVARPAGAHRTGVAVERTWTPAPVAPEVAPEVPEPAPVVPVEVPVAEPRQVTPDVAPAPVTAAPPAPVIAPVAAEVAPALSPFDAWLEHPTFTCDPGFAPGWLGEDGIPTSCVAN